jgi:amino acid transporter
MISVLSVGNSSIYGSSRTLAALAEQHQAPQFIAYIDRQGRPLIAIMISSAMGLIAYTSVIGTRAENQVFNWLLAISGLSSVFTWLTICLCHIRFRAAWKYHGHTLDELPFKSQPGVIGSWLGFVFNSLVFVAQFWTGFSPEGYASMTANELVVNFFEVYLAAPIILVSYIGYKLWFKTKFVKLSEIDISTGKNITGDDLQILKDMDRADYEAKPWWGKALCSFLLV